MIFELRYRTKKALVVYVVVDGKLSSWGQRDIESSVEISLQYVVSPAVFWWGVNLEERAILVPSFALFWYTLHVLVTIP